MARNPIPPDQAVWGRFNELAENNLIIERRILEQASVESAKRDANTQKIGDYYASCMDETAIEKKGLEPLRAELDRIAGLESKAELPAYLAHAHRIGSNAFFEFSSQPDFQNASLEIAETDQSGLGLPDRDYYLKTDPNSVALREKYVQYMQRMLVLAGEKPETAAANTKAIMAIETALAKASLDRVSRRDPARLYHDLTLADLGKLSPAFDWNLYIARQQNAQVQHAQCGGARVRERLQRRGCQHRAGRHQDLSEVASALDHCIDAAQSFRGRAI